MTKLTSFFLKAIFVAILLNSIGIAFADQMERTQGVACPGCYASKQLDADEKPEKGGKEDIGKGKTEKEKFRCFNCDRRPCVATKETWMRLWHRYMGVNSTSKKVQLSTWRTVSE